MAEASIPVAQDEFSCPVCLDLLKEPVTTACGHSYCKSCITDCWDQEDQKGVYSCPQCRHTFSPRPALATNVLVAEVVEKLKKTRLQAADSFAGSGDVQCDVCTGSKHKAVKSCLVCLNSYCLNHLEQHESFFRGKKHNLTDATGRLPEMNCTKHDEQLKLFCRTDQCCICYPCLMDEHKNHETVTAEAERTKKQRILKKTQKTLQQRIQQREKDLQQLRETVESHKRSAQTAVEDSERIFTSFSGPPESTEQPSIIISSHVSFTHVGKSVSRLKEKLEDFCKEEIEEISGRVTSKTKTRPELLRCKTL
ncbi:E3 ubiquitin/ISG15 ligase TRIM25-like [Cyprinus carpio]|uniref:E3 ubiquitin/ISG15 ligase TRIM25-like n=1 Tax=Cyprinus carpio TaxID=7962 RepID=A0A9Q9VTB2_CYPCA|nr:E3 ubiquitin/ISG15 ligase TRIM25-like [Cyprinus carpio]